MTRSFSSIILILLILILGELPDLSGYETILVGGPVWTGTFAPPVMRFLE